jgi:hypothetical protein
MTNYRIEIHGDVLCVDQRAVWPAFGSIWPSAIAHGCLNAFVRLGTRGMRLSSGVAIADAVAKRLHASS